LKVYLVIPHDLKSLPGRKSDVSDCQSIQYLHSVGMFSATSPEPVAKRFSMPSSCGQRDRLELAQISHPWLKSPRNKMAQTLVGDCRPEHLFT